jgi:hypothetical protein
VGGFGLALAVWLSNRGARNLVLTSKRGMRTGGQRKVIQMLQKRGVQVRTHLLLPQHLKFTFFSTISLTQFLPSPFLLFGSNLQHLKKIALRMNNELFLMNAGGGVQAGRG